MNTYGKTCLVTGSEGFIGRHLKKELAILGGWENIVSIDIKPKMDMDTGKDTFFRLSVEEFIGKYWNYLPDKLDSIFHLAALSSPVEVENRPFDGIRTNILGSAAVLEFARRWEEFNPNPINVIFASSSAITGHSLYGLTKNTSEDIATYYRKNYSVDAVSCRFFNTFGNDEFKGDYTSMPTQFLDKAMKDEPIVIYGDGKQSRDFIYIKDLVQWLIQLNDVDDVRRKSQRFDFGTGVTTSYNDLANMIIRLTNSHSKIKYVKNPLKNYQRLTKANLPFTKPKYTLEEALKDMIEERKHIVKPLNGDAPG